MLNIICKNALYWGNCLQKCVYYSELLTTMSLLGEIHNEMLTNLNEGFLIIFLLQIALKKCRELNLRLEKFTHPFMRATVQQVSMVNACA